MATAGREPMSALIKEKEICSTSLVDIWCVIDFMEKAGSDREDLPSGNLTVCY